MDPTGDHQSTSACRRSDGFVLGERGASEIGAYLQTGFSFHTVSPDKDASMTDVGFLGVIWSASNQMKDARFREEESRLSVSRADDTQFRVGGFLTMMVHGEIVAHASEGSDTVIIGVIDGVQEGETRGTRRMWMGNWFGGLL